MAGISSAAGSPGRQSMVLNVGLWALQVILAILFGSAGIMKTTLPMAELAEKLVWPGALPEPLVRFIGTAELLGALGVILPAATRIRPWLTPLAAAGLVAIMLLAIPFHLSRGEAQVLPIPLALGALAVLVAWGRFRIAPVAPRGR